MIQCDRRKFSQQALIFDLGAAVLDDRHPAATHMASACGVLLMDLQPDAQAG
jgi:hypothetical protein